MKKAIGLALAVLAMSVVAASAQGSNRITAVSAAGVSCKSTITLPLVTPVTGGAGFLGAEQGAWAKYAVKTLAKPLGLKVKFVLGDTPVEQGPAPTQAVAQKYIAVKSVLVVLGRRVGRHNGPAARAAGGEAGTGHGVRGQLKPALRANLCHV